MEKYIELNNKMINEIDKADYLLLGPFTFLVYSLALILFIIVFMSFYELINNSKRHGEIMELNDKYKKNNFVALEKMTFLKKVEVNFYKFFDFVMEASKDITFVVGGLGIILALGFLVSLFTIIDVSYNVTEIENKYQSEIIEEAKKNYEYVTNSYSLLEIKDNSSFITNGLILTYLNENNEIETISYNGKIKINNELDLNDDKIGIMNYETPFNFKDYLLKQGIDKTTIEKYEEEYPLIKLGLGYFEKGEIKSVEINNYELIK